MVSYVEAAEKEIQKMKKQEFIRRMKKAKKYLVEKNQEIESAYPSHYRGMCGALSKAELPWAKTIMSWLFGTNKRTRPTSEFWWERNYKNTKRRLIYLDILEQHILSEKLYRDIIE